MQFYTWDKKCIAPLNESVYFPPVTFLHVVTFYYEGLWREWALQDKKWYSILDNLFIFSTFFMNSLRFI